MIQPTPAPPVIAAGIAVAGTIGGAATGSVGTAVISGVAAGAVTAGVTEAASKGHKRFVVRDGATSSTFSACMGDSLYADGVHIYVSDDSALITNIPASCMGQIEAYNAHPNITDLNALHGSTTPLNSSAILISGAPDYVMAQLQGLVGSNATGTASG